LYVMDPREPRTDKLALQLDGGGWDVTDWSRDGSKLALIEFISVNESYIWIADLKTGTRTLITPKGGARVAYGGAKFTADERGLWVTTDREFGFQRLARLDLATGRHDYLTTRIPWDVSDFDLSPDRRTLAYTTNEGGDFVLRVRDAASGRERRVTGLPTGVLDNPKFHRDGRELAVQSFNPRTPGDAWSIDLATGRARAWTASELGGLNPEAIQLPRRVKWKSFDGLEISGWLTQPPARFTGKRPVIIDIHGGPEGQALPMYKGRRNFFLNELGVAVIDPNVRGSGGFGKDFIALDNGFLRENSYKDIGALLDWIAQQPDLDASRVMVTGGSYGGHMTWAISYLYSERLRSALPVVGMSNLVSFLQNTEAYRRDLRRAEYGDERDPTMRDFLERIAPMNHAAQIRHPVFVVQGRNDPRVPWSESDQMVRTIRSNGTPVWFLTANNEGHGFGKKPNQDFEFYATVMFIRETLLK
jgi:dipeptidyl aminopeptidase/acylaminoacyl peptidase